MEGVGGIGGDIVADDRAPCARHDHPFIEFELEKAERGMGMPYDAERVMQLRNMLREARKRNCLPG